MPVAFAVLALTSNVRLFDACMGLDWNPGPKAKPECGQEFCELWNRLHSKSCFFRDRKLKRFQEITTSAFDTLRTPRVGLDFAATEWAHKEAFPERQDKSLTEDLFVAQMRGSTSFRHVMASHATRMAMQAVTSSGIHFEGNF